MRLTRSAYVGTSAGLIAGVLLLNPLAAHAAWDASASDASGSATALVLPAMRTPEVRAAGDAVHVDWAASSAPRVRGYRVTRTDLATGRTVAAERGCSGVITKTACTEVSVPAGRWEYAVVALVGDDWRSAPGVAASITISDEKPDPAPMVTPAPTTPAPIAPAPIVSPTPSVEPTPPPSSSVSPAPTATPKPTRSVEPVPSATTEPAPETTTPAPESPQPSVEITAEETPAPAES